MSGAVGQFDPHVLAGQAKARARELGFDLVGIAPADPSSRAEYFRQWLSEGRHGTMDWLLKRVEERADPAKYLPGAGSVICVGMNYHIPLEAPGPEDAPFGARVARYALGDDYHEVMKKRLHALADWLRQAAGGGWTKCAVDTAPVMEKDLASRAGIGWLAKNTCIISERIGSWLLLGEVLTTLELPPDDPAIDRCGTCRRCIDACPTGAITAPYQLDARRCISYLTIEHRDPIDAALEARMGDWLFGCDICQEVCPWNRDAPAASDPALQPRFKTGQLDVRRLLEWTDKEYQSALRHSAMKRVKLPVLQRNGRIVRKNLERGTPA